MERHVCAPSHTIFTHLLQMKFFKMAYLINKVNFRLGMLLPAILYFYAHCVMADDSSPEIKTSNFHVMMNHCFLAF